MTAHALGEIQAQKRPEKTLNSSFTQRQTTIIPVLNNNNKKIRRHTKKQESMAHAR